MVKDPLGNEVEVPLYKDDLLTIAEMDRCIRFLIGLVTDKDPNWSLENDPL